MKGGRRQGRQRKRWEDNSREWTGLEFAKSQRACSGEQEKMAETVCEIICGAPTTLAVKGEMMMMMKVYQRYILKDGKKMKTYDSTASSEFDSCGKLGLCPADVIKGDGCTGLHWSPSLA